MDSTEQWLTEGKCELCRRKYYCKKDCTANKKVKEKWMRTVGKMVIDGRLGMQRNMQRSAAAIGAFLRVCKARGISEDTSQEMLNRCRKLALESNQPQYVYIDMLLENLHRPQMSLEECMNRMERTHKEQCNPGIIEKTVDNVIAAEKRLQEHDRGQEETEEPVGADD